MGHGCRGEEWVREERKNGHKGRIDYLKRNGCSREGKMRKREKRVEA